jgi:hypothetical protein
VSAVIAIGGGASTGMTTLAAALAARCRPTDIAHVDDLVPRLDREQGSGFLATTPDVWHRDPHWLCAELVRWTATRGADLHGAVLTALSAVAVRIRCQFGRRA